MVKKLQEDLKSAQDQLQKGTAVTHACAIDCMAVLQSKETEAREAEQKQEALRLQRDPT